MDNMKMLDDTAKKKLQRMNNKMNKLKAFLQLTQKGKSSNIPEKNGLRIEQSPDSGIEVEPKRVLLADELQHLRARLRAQQKEKMSRPLLFQTTDQKSLQELQVAEIRQLFMYALEGGNAPGIKPGWCQLERWHKVSQIVIVCVENMSKQDLLNYSEQDGSVREFLTVSGCFAPTGTDGLSRSLLEYQVSHRRLAKLGKLPAKDEILTQVYKSYSTIPKPLLQSTTSEQSCRLSLLMSMERMILEKYPLPVQGSEVSHYVRTKEVYDPLSGESPLFAVDCEMCMTSTNRSELTRISIVNEKLQVVYDTYVKPFNPVVNYLTKYSGITKSILDPVKTRLHDVQAAVRKLLPADAILCGQSLNGDLHALEMMHPYVIDTSIVYNLTGNPRAKSSLKLLSQVLLGKSIQTSGMKGHDSVEDSRTTMELVLLKLKFGPGFGDVTSGWKLNPSEEDQIVEKPTSENLDSLDNVIASAKESFPLPLVSAFPAKRKNPDSDNNFPLQEFTADTPKTSCHFNQSILKCAADAEKEFLVVGTSEYVAGLVEKEPKVQIAESSRKALKFARDNISGVRFLLCEVAIPEVEDVEKRKTKVHSVMRKVWKLFRDASDRSLCALVLSGRLSVDGERQGLCFANIKNAISMPFFGSVEEPVSMVSDLD